VTPHALLLAPSRGRGGGIERYVQTIEWAFASQGVHCQRIDLGGSGLAEHLRLLTRATQALRSCDSPARLVVAHSSLLPTASAAASRHPECQITLVCHGIEVWGSQLRARHVCESYLMRRPGVRVVAVSSFTAGVLARGCPATILPPGLSQDWFSTLAKAGSAARRRDDPRPRLVTAFRLADWRYKGLPELLQALADLRTPDVTVCGSGEPPAALRDLLARHPRCTLRSGLSDQELAAELAAADLCVLATRTRFGRRAYGEGFGLVLIEAQVAGTPVVAPAHGGSHEAFVDGITGVAPADESASSLRRTLDCLLTDRARLAKMSSCAAEWARSSFAPERYAPLAVARLL
jgi:glycosyltransferase involved in cell wall biosynthesis